MKHSLPKSTLLRLISLHSMGGKVTSDGHGVVAVWPSRDYMLNTTAQSHTPQLSHCAATRPLTTCPLHEDTLLKAALLSSEQVTVPSTDMI